MREREYVWMYIYVCVIIEHALIEDFMGMTTFTDTIVVLPFSFCVCEQIAAKRARRCVNDRSHNNNVYGTLVRERIE